MRHKILIFTYIGILIPLSTASSCAAPLHQSSYPFISGDTFRSIADHIIDETNQPFCAQNVAPYDIIFVKTDYIGYFFATIHQNINNPYILITHNSDYSPIYRKTRPFGHQVYDLSGFLYDKKLVAWFAQNSDYAHPKLKPIPIGLANSYWPHGSMENFLHATQNIPALATRSEKIYLNINLNTNPSERRPIVSFFERQPYVYKASFKSHAEYLEEMKSYRYVLCPPGNGTDCHRTWEALLLGCIPIMQRSSLDKMFDDLPVILIDDWSEVTEELLRAKYEEIQKRCYKLETIYADYWIRFIKSFKSSPC